MLRRIFFAIIILSGLWLMLDVCTIPNSKGLDRASHHKMILASLEIDTQKVYKRVEKMPLFKKCDPPSLVRRENRSCSTTAINQYIYPRLKRFDSCEISKGRITTELLIDRKGMVEDVRIKSSFGCQPLDDHLLQILKEMPPWEKTGMQNNIPVKVIYTIPVQLRY